MGTYTVVCKSFRYYFREVDVRSGIHQETHFVVREGNVPVKTPQTVP